MSNATVVTLIICGTLCVVAPWVYSGYYGYTVANVMAQPGSHSVTLFNESLESSYKAWSVFLGACMIACGAFGSMRARKREGSPNKS